MKVVIDGAATPTPKLKTGMIVASPKMPRYAYLLGKESEPPSRSLSGKCFACISFDQNSGEVQAHTSGIFDDSYVPFTGTITLSN
jgi:hypothetical protein